MVYAHPIIGAVVVALFFWLTSLGYRSRHRKPYAPAARRTHRRLGVIALSLGVTAAVTGTASTALLRPDLGLAASTHFYVGWALVTAMVGLYLLRRRHHLHPLLGLLALLAAPLVGALGFEMLP